MQTSRAGNSNATNTTVGDGERAVTEGGGAHAQFEVQFNPLVPLQSLLSAELVSTKQRVKAAQQLENYFQQLGSTPEMLLSYEPYLPLLADIMVTPAKGAQELQASVLAMLVVLSSHSPLRFSEWIARHTQLGNEPWFVQWSYALLLEAEKRVPNVEAGLESRPSIPLAAAWDENSTEFREFDGAFARIIQMWRTLLDHTADAALVGQLVKCLHSLLPREQEDGAEQWRTMLFRKMQSHFVDIADVLIGWTMSTGPNRPLREDIVSLLHLMGRLWADNSVFSLQLLNSFADEIVSLCDSWSEHQAEDGDRLSTLLACFMMVAQCVPDLALPSDAAVEGPFVRVLERVASSREIEYSLFCITNCAEYMASISESSRSKFPSLSVVAVRFLLFHGAVLSRKHDSDIDKIALIVEKAQTLARNNFPRIGDLSKAQTEAVGLFEDDIRVRVASKKGHQPKRMKILECLLQLKCANGITLITQLSLQLMRVGGIGALKVLGSSALEALDNRNVEGGTSYFVFAATCFILASRNHGVEFTENGDLTYATDILETLATKLDQQRQRHRQHRLAPRQLCLVLKMACTFLAAVAQASIDNNDVTATAEGASLRILESAIRMLPSGNIMIRDSRLMIEALKVVGVVLSRTRLVPAVPHGLRQNILKRVNEMAHCSSVKVRAECVQVLKALSSRPADLTFASDVFEVSLDLVLDASANVASTVISDVWSNLAASALVAGGKKPSPLHVAQSLHTSFVMADFDSIMRLLSHQESDVGEWKRVCSLVQARIHESGALNGGESCSNSDVFLGAIHQAAAWCVQNRLRTHFGGPAQTFSSIEQLLMEYSVEGHGRDLVDWSTGNLDEAELASTRQPTLLKRLSKWMTLEFVSALEMCIMHAIGALDVEQNNPESESYKTALFFRTNKVVCDDWLNRIRPLLRDMSSNTLSHELCRHHTHAMLVTCYGRLNRLLMSPALRTISEKVYNELKLAEKEVDSALFLLCGCYCDAKDVDSIIGFQKWGESLSAALRNQYEANSGSAYVEEVNWKVPLFRWQNAMRFEAEMRYEEAAAEYETILLPIFAAPQKSSADGDVSVAKLFEAPMMYLRLSPAALLGCFKQCAKCYAAVKNWTKLREFVTQFVEAVASLADHDRPIEGIQSVFDCSDTWSEELDTIRNLAAQASGSFAEHSANAADFDDDLSKRATLALHEWGIIDDSDRQCVKTASSFRNGPLQVGQLRADLLPLALQPGPWNRCAGENVGKEVERVLLRVSGLAPHNQLATPVFTVNPPSTVGPIVRALNPAVHDSTAWSRSFFGARMPAMYDLSEATNVAGQHALYLTGVAKLARKQHNFSFAQNLLTDAENVRGVTESSLTAVNYEKARLFDAIGMEDKGCRLLEMQCEANVTSIRTADGVQVADDSAPTYLLRLAMTIAKEDSLELLSPTIARFLTRPPPGADDQGKSSLTEIDASANYPVQAAVRTCLQAATQISPTSAKAWLRYSNWCYDLGKHEMAQIIEQNGYIHLSPSDEVELITLLDQMNLAETDRDPVVRTFCHFLENGEPVNRRADVFRRLCMDRAPLNADSRIVDRLVQLQDTCHCRVLHFHSLAACGYGKYLTMLLTDTEAGAPKQNMVMAALRLLGLLTAYGAKKEVATALEDVFVHGPVAPWSYVVPQLIARAHHPVAMVSSMVCLILKRLARHLPHAIVYQAVVDSMETLALSSVPHEERHSSSNTFGAVLQELQNVSSGQVEGVRLLVSELRRISILWDEAWISTLMKLSTDVARRSSTLEKEASRVEKNASLSVQEKDELAQRKLVAIMKPILLSIERLWKETCGGASEQHALTPHERFFLKDYGGAFDEAIARFRECCNLEVPVDHMSSATKSRELWQPFADILKALLNSAGRRDQLALREISPAMSSTSSQLALTNIPGAFSGKSARQTEPITIHGVHSSVAVLRTKTKPKSLEFIGSDGQTYKYLLKAREDLRLDERIMQFLKVADDFLSADTAATCRDLSAQNYSVIPLSRNAGLIQMVPDVVPLFQVFTSRNEQVASGRAPQASPPGKGGGSAATLLLPIPTQQPQPPPPTAQFYAKLKQLGISDVSPNQRAKWPVSVLRQAYQELVAQRPRNILQQDLLLRSGDLRESWSKSARLSKSLAVMSVLGYIVGLGDRHLDNILLCVKSGDIVHIDYNVCFDKGRKLKVPEIVPFRLTPMLQDALGLTGVEGKFRVAFETTLRVVRAETAREALLTLLEAFVYSPLVDWIVEENRRGRSGDLKARLEVNVNLSLFLSRAEERRQDTISFGRQYDTLMDGVSRGLEATKVPFAYLLDQRKELLSLENEEQELSMAISSAESELSAFRRTQQAECVAVEAVRAQVNDIVSRLTSFGNECLARHQQIETWRKKNVNFSKSETNLDAVVDAVQSTSFQLVHATFCNAVEQSPFVAHSRELLAALESKCRAVDMDVGRLRFEIERLATCLQPYLVAYGHCREDLDAYLDSEHGAAGKDVYFMWWHRCAERLHLLESDNFTEGTDVSSLGSGIAAPIGVPSRGSVAESAWALERLDHLRHENMFLPESANTIDAIEEEAEQSTLFAQVDQLIHGVWETLSGMKLSNAQGQRLLKLAGASWVVDALGVLEKSDTSFVKPEGAASTTLMLTIQLPLFQTVAAVSQACGTLLDLVSTPKGSMKRVGAGDFLHAASSSQKEPKEATTEAGKCLALFSDVLQAVELFAATIQEELLFDLHGMQRDKIAYVEALELLQATVAISAGTQEVIDMVSKSAVAGASGKSSPLQDAFVRCPAISTTLAAAASVLEKLSGFLEVLERASMLTDEEAMQLKSSATVSWVRLVLNLVEPFVVETGDQNVSPPEKQASVIWSFHMEAFLGSCLVKQLRSLLASIIATEWKFKFFALASDGDEGAEQSPLSNRWSAFFSSQILEILPSTMVALPNGSSEMHARDVNSQVVSLTKRCEMWWRQQWRVTQSQLSIQRISSFQLRHERRLRYAAWVAPQPSAVAEFGRTPELTRAHLLSFLSSQVPHLNALLADQLAVETAVLELAQQMEYIASELSSGHAHQRSADGSLHDHVQGCYSKVTTLFEFGRGLADLVQGVSVIETSTREALAENRQAELEVDVVGKSIMLAASDIVQQLQTANRTMLEHDVAVHAVQDEIDRKRLLHDALVEKTRGHEQTFLAICCGKEEQVLEVSRALRDQATSLLVLLKSFDKFKAPSKQKPATTATTDLSKAGKSSSLSPERSAPAAGYSFMENDRLVKILLRSIRSVKHLKLLENVLGKHEQVGVELRGVVSRIEQALRDFAGQIGPLLTVSDTNKDSSENAENSSLSSSFLSITRGKATSSPSTAAGRQRFGSVSTAKMDQSTADDQRIGCKAVHILLDLIQALHLVRIKRPSGIQGVATEEEEASVLLNGRDLVRRCVKLFFEATEMADRFSSTEEENCRAVENTALPDELGEDDEEPRDSAEDVAGPAALVSSASGVLHVSGSSNSPSDTVPTTAPGTFTEEKNPYGLQVLKRIEEKLSGNATELANAPVLTVEQQASWLIEEATKVDNLCVMYEGWTPWI